MDSARIFLTKKYAEFGFRVEDGGEKGFLISLPDFKSKIIISNDEIKELPGGLSAV